VGDEYDMPGRVRSLDPGVDVVHPRQRSGPVRNRLHGRRRLDGGTQPEILQLPDQILTDLGVGRRPHRMRALGDLLDVGEGPLRRELVCRSARG
jgi:hypothetical protein